MPAEACSRRNWRQRGEVVKALETAVDVPGLALVAAWIDPCKGAARAHCARFVTSDRHIVLPLVLATNEDDEPHNDAKRDEHAHLPVAEDWWRPLTCGSRPGRWRSRSCGRPFVGVSLSAVRRRPLFSPVPLLLGQWTDGERQSAVGPLDLKSHDARFVLFLIRHGLECSAHGRRATLGGGERAALAAPCTDRWTLFCPLGPPRGACLLAPGSFSLSPCNCPRHGDDVASSQKGCPRSTPAPWRARPASTALAPLWRRLAFSEPAESSARADSQHFFTDFFASETAVGEPLEADKCYCCRCALLQLLLTRCVDRRASPRRSHAAP